MRFIWLWLKGWHECAYRSEDKKCPWLARRGETQCDIHLHITEVFREKSEREYGAWKSE